jgi:hypothetical protein
MAPRDAFSAQIIELVRRMPDEAILELVKHQLGALGVSQVRALTPDQGRRGRTARGMENNAENKSKSKRHMAPNKRHVGRPRRTPPRSAERQQILANVEQLVKASSGMSASDVAKSAGVPQTRAAAALKELKLAKRIFQGGDRRFARYAGEVKVAEQASAIARKNAAGPTPAKKPAASAKRAPQPTAK